ncbi:MAG: DUF2309 domain-containing protein [Methylomicrobium sp.]
MKTLNVLSQRNADIAVEDTPISKPVTMNPSTVSSAATAACSYIPPLWPLQQFVAVNPFLGLLSQSFAQANHYMSRAAHRDLLMPVDFYLEQLAGGRITDHDLAKALALFDKNGEFGSTDDVKALLCSMPTESLTAKASIQTIADSIDSEWGTEWSAFVVEEISKWCAAYFDEGQSSWRMPWRSLPLFEAWKQSASFDRTAETQGIKGFRDFVRTLPDEPLPAIDFVLRSIRVSEANLVDFFHRQLLTVAGWSAYLQYRTREAGMQGRDDDTLMHLLAIRLVWDRALQTTYYEKMPSLRQVIEIQPSEPDSSEKLRLLLQQAYEIGIQRKLIDKLKPSNKRESASSRQKLSNKAVQAVFCIDVRSEVYRRALETVSPRVETFGFAGFFGFPVEYIRLGHQHGAAHCPVLLTPKFRIRESLSKTTVEELNDALNRRWSFKRFDKLWKSFKTSAVSCFSYVEIAGLAFGVKLLTDSFGLTRTVSKPGTEGLNPSSVPRLGPQVTRQRGRLVATGKVVETGLRLSDKIELAKNALRGIGLTSHFARLVLLCGHGSTTVNNPYAAGLDCGACGGQSGEASARIAATVLNDVAVRAGLANHGIDIPSDTWFLAGLHDTTTDELRLFDLDQLPSGYEQDLASLQAWLADASELTRNERSTVLGIDETNSAKIERRIAARSRDWSEVRPEWGLAGNAAFIAAPRDRTRRVKLNGRAFLHNYDFNQDADGSILELIMTAPLVVASWINLQYYASTIDNRLFGSGNKVLHNVVGTIGVLEGNGGDLRSGLPWQSLHDGYKFVHEPVRLSVFIEAPRSAIEAVIAKHESVSQLTDNQWLHLFSIENDRYFRYLGHHHWQPETAIDEEINHV